MDKGGDISPEEACLVGAPPCAPPSAASGLGIPEESDAPEVDPDVCGVSTTGA